MGDSGSFHECYTEVFPHFGKQHLKNKQKRQRGEHQKFIGFHVTHSVKNGNCGQQHALIRLEFVSNKCGY